MANWRRNRPSSDQAVPSLPPGVKLLYTLKGHRSTIYSVSLSPDGRTLASGGEDSVIRVWDVESGGLLRTLKGHKGTVRTVAFDPVGRVLASSGSDGRVLVWDAQSDNLLRTLKGSDSWGMTFDPTGRFLAGGGNGTVMLWDAQSGRPLRTLKGREGFVWDLAFNADGRTLAASSDKVIMLWDTESGRQINSLQGHKNIVRSLAFDPVSQTLASGGDDGTLNLWEAKSWKLVRTLEGHTSQITTVSFSRDGRLIASRSWDDTVRLWRCDNWDTVALIPELANAAISKVLFHPDLSHLFTIGSKQGVDLPEADKLIHVYDLDLDVLLAKGPRGRAAVQAVHHTTAKVVLVGDSGVGKTGLGWRLAHGEFKEHASTHGQQFWVVDELGTRREDGTECEAILWDLAGQPDYRLTHALFLDDADLALVLFDPTDIRDPLHGVEFWLKQLRTGRKKAGEAQDGCCPTILVGARADRGEARLTREELDEFCRQRGISGGYLATSAKAEIGLDELLRRMQALVAWEQKAATVTTVTFKRIKDYVLGLKENPRRRKVIVNPEELRKRLEKTDKGWEFTDAEMMTAVGHLANYGYVRVLRTSRGEERVLLAPELLNNLAASFVLEARRNQRGLGSLEEKRLLEGGYSFPELERLSAAERELLLDAAALLFLEHNVCFRETDPLSQQSYLVFPELINLKKPLLEDERPTEDGAAYTVGGAVENVYASLVVLLGYTQTFTRTDQWRSHARYEVGDRLICGFRQEAEREGELDFVIYFGENVGAPVRTLFQGLFESFLARRNLSVFRYEPVACANGHTLNRGVVREQLGKGNAFAFCPECGGRIQLPKADEPIQLTQTERRKVDEQQWFAARRSLFEQTVFNVRSYAESQKLPSPECFISYAWGDRAQERWVEKSLATDLQKAGLRVLLDRWENSRVGSSVLRFVERIDECDYVIVVGTPLYRKKAKNVVSKKGSVVAAEWDLAGMRLLAAEADKRTVMPVLLAGSETEALPPLLRGNVYADFRDERAYFAAAFDLILSIYNIPFNHQAVADLREKLRESPLT